MLVSATITIVAVSLFFWARHQQSEAIKAKSEAEVARRDADVQRGDAEEQKTLADQATLRAERQLARSESLLYTSHIANAHHEWERVDVREAWRFLDMCRWDYRGWEHDYLYTLFNQNQTTLQGHSSYVLSVAFSPDGKRIVSGSSDNTIKVWLLDPDWF